MDIYRMLSPVFLCFAIYVIWFARYEHCWPVYIGGCLILFLALNYWCGFPFGGWWKRRNLWK